MWKPELTFLIVDFNQTKKTQDLFRGQFHQQAYKQLLPTLIPKAQKDSQVISRKKVDRQVVLLYFIEFVLYTVH